MTPAPKPESPLPWKIEDCGDGKLWIVAADDTHIVNTLSSRRINRNVAHIVHCVNSHAKLVEALKRIAIIEAGSDCRFVAREALRDAGEGGGE